MVKFISVVVLVLSLQIVGCSDDERSAPASLVPSGSAVIKLSSDQFKFTEGPVWDGEGNVYFTDLGASEIYRFHVPDTSFHRVRNKTWETNGLALSPQHELWGAVHQSGSIVRMDTQGKILWTVAGEYGGRAYNQPNDLALDAQGGVYFTDPSWNPPEKRNQPVKGVYYVDASGEVSLLVDDMDKPNGVLLTNGGQSLYVVDMGSDDFYRYPVIAPGRLGAREVFATLARDGDTLAAPDGLAADTDGNIYVATATGIQVFSKAGDSLGTIAVPQRPSNLAFYGKNRNKLFITAETNVYSLTLDQQGDNYPLFQGVSQGE